MLRTAHPSTPSRLRTVALALGFGALVLMPLPAAAQTAGDAGTTTTTRDDRDDGGFDMGWLGLIGLAGLAGLRRRPEVHHDTTHTTRRP